MIYNPSFADLPEIHNADCIVVRRLMKSLAADPILKMHYEKATRDVSFAFNKEGSYYSVFGNCMNCNGFMISLGCGSTVPFDTQFIWWLRKLIYTDAKRIECRDNVPPNTSDGQTYIGSCWSGIKDMKFQDLTLRKLEAIDAMDSIVSKYNRTIINDRQDTNGIIVGYALILPKTDSTNTPTKKDDEKEFSEDGIIITKEDS